MLKSLGIVFILFFTSLLGYSQGEKLHALEFNTEIESSSNAKMKAASDDVYIYELDTMHLPFFDDFSTDRFKKYTATANDAGVTAETFYRIWDEFGVLVSPDTVKYATDSTFSYEIDSTDLGVDTVITKTPLASEIITRYDFSEYPFTSSNVEVWPAYTLYDTVYLNKTKLDTVWNAIVDLEQDSATVYTVPADNYSYWMENSVYRNYRYAKNPMSIGVATFDGVDSTGIPYEFSSNTRGVADVLTSKPIFLSTKPQAGFTYDQNSDVYFSFYYQAGGNGDTPEANDSLVVEFYSPLDKSWNWVWSTTGGASTDDFTGVILPIPTTKNYYLDGFRFRFKNYANLNGNLDHWHIDYVELGEGRLPDDFEIGDLALTDFPGSLLEDYEAVPWTHYVNDPDAFVSSTKDILVKNNSLSIPLSLDIGGTKVQVDYQGVTQIDEAFMSIDDVNPQVVKAVNITLPTATTVFDPNLHDTLALFDVYYGIDPGDDNEKSHDNDSIHYVQEFYNYYAYDDGTAEAAYGPFGNGVKVAYQFDFAIQDTLRALSMYFMPTVHDARDKIVFLTVWDNAGGKPGSIVYQDSSSAGRLVTYNGGFNQYVEYELQQELVLQGRYYVGWLQSGWTTSQSDVNGMNIGFDRNRDHSDRIFYDVDGTWRNTGFEGSLMIRPIFSSKQDYVQALNEFALESDVVMYPNPSSGLVNFSGAKNFDHLQVIDIQGKVLHSGSFDGYQIDLQHLESGIYFLSLYNTKTQQFDHQKIILE